MKILLLLTLFQVLTFGNRLWAKGEFILSEESINELLKTYVPTLEQIKLKSLGTKSQSLSLDEKYDPQLTASASYLKSNEKSLNQYMPVTTNAKNASLGIMQNLSYGLGLQAEIFSQKVSNTIIENSTTTGASVALSMDLYRDLFGRVSRAKLNQNHLELKRRKLEEELGRIQFINSIRKVYWSLVANEEAIRTTKKLLESSSKQLKETLKKFRSKVADSGEVNRNKAQVSSRKASLISLYYQREALIRQLKELIPSLAEREIKLKNYNIDNTIKEVLVCSVMIKSYQKLPVENTKYDEVIELLKEEEVSASKQLKNYDGMDLKLLGEYQTTGKAFNQSDAYDDLTDDYRNTYSVGLQLNIPFGDSKKSNKEVQQALNQRLKKAQRQESLAKVKAYHEQTVKIIDYLREAVENQRENSVFLSKSLKSSRRKYAQARISIEQLIQEQDGLFQSELDVIQTNLTVIHTLMDYFSIFSETPCDLNRTKL